MYKYPNRNWLFASLKGSKFVQMAMCFLRLGNLFFRLKNLINIVQNHTLKGCYLAISSLAVYSIL